MATTVPSATSNTAGAGGNGGRRGSGKGARRRAVGDVEEEEVPRGVLALHETLQRLLETDVLSIPRAPSAMDNAELDISEVQEAHTVFPSESDRSLPEMSSIAEKDFSDLCDETNNDTMLSAASFGEADLLQDANVSDASVCAAVGHDTKGPRQDTGITGTLTDGPFSPVSMLRDDILQEVPEPDQESGMVEREDRRGHRHKHSHRRFFHDEDSKANNESTMINRGSSASISASASQSNSNEHNIDVISDDEIDGDDKKNSSDGRCNDVEDIEELGGKKGNSGRNCRKSRIESCEGNNRDNGVEGREEEGKRDKVKEVELDNSSEGKEGECVIEEGEEDEEEELEEEQGEEVGDMKGDAVAVGGSCAVGVSTDGSSCSLLDTECVESARARESQPSFVRGAFAPNLSRHSSTSSLASKSTAEMDTGDRKYSRNVRQSGRKRGHMRSGSDGSDSTALSDTNCSDITAMSHDEAVEALLWKKLGTYGGPAAKQFTFVTIDQDLDDSRKAGKAAVGDVCTGATIGGADHLQHASPMSSSSKKPSGISSIFRRFGPKRDAKDSYLGASDTNRGTRNGTKVSNISISMAVATETQSGEKEEGKGNRIRDEEDDLVSGDYSSKQKITSSTDSPLSPVKFDTEDSDELTLHTHDLKVSSNIVFVDDNDADTTKECSADDIDDNSQTEDSSRIKPSCGVSNDEDSGKRLEVVKDENDDKGGDEEKDDKEGGVIEEKKEDKTGEDKKKERQSGDREGKGTELDEKEGGVTRGRGKGKGLVKKSPPGNPEMAKNDKLLASEEQFLETVTYFQKTFEKPLKEMVKKQSSARQLEQTVSAVFGATRKVCNLHKSVVEKMHELLSDSKPTSNALWSLASDIYSTYSAFIEASFHGVGTITDFLSTQSELLGDIFGQGPPNSQIRDTDGNAITETVSIFRYFMLLPARRLEYYAEILTELDTKTSRTDSNKKSIHRAAKKIRQLCESTDKNDHARSPEAGVASSSSSHSSSFPLNSKTSKVQHTAEPAMTGTVFLLEPESIIRAHAELKGDHITFSTKHSRKLVACATCKILPVIISGSSSLSSPPQSLVVMIADDKNRTIFCASTDEESQNWFISISGTTATTTKATTLSTIQTV